MDLKIVGTSDGGIPVYRHTWSDGSWWEFYGEQPWVVTRLLRQRLAPLDPEKDEDAQQMSEISRTVRLTYGTLAWSWDLPVVESSLDTLKSTKVLELSRVMSELHLKSDLNEVGVEQKKAYSGRWWRGILSRLSGWTFTITRRRSEPELSRRYHSQS